MCWPSGKNHRGGGQRIKGSKGRNRGRGGEGLKHYVTLRGEIGEGLKQGWVPAVALAGVGARLDPTPPHQRGL